MKGPKYASTNRQGRLGRDRMVVGFTTAYAISTTLCDKVCQ
jgi:hypothetical protein